MGKASVEPVRATAFPLSQLRATRHATLITQHILRCAFAASYAKQ